MCVCSNNSREFNSECMADGTFAGIIAGICGFILLLILWRFLAYRREKNDEVWKVNVDELHFSHPPEIIGQGAFGVVLLSEYRGTNVAIKRVLPVKKGKGSRFSGSVAASTSNEDGEAAAENKNEEHADPNQSQDIEANFDSFGLRRGSLATTTASTGNNSKLDFLVGLAQRRRRQSAVSRFLFGNKETSAYNMNILGTASQSSMSRKGLFASVFPWCDDNTQRQNLFKEEMRLLSRLRHPCITTVMGAVMNGLEPMMVSIAITIT